MKRYRRDYRAIIDVRRRKVSERLNTVLKGMIGRGIPEEQIAVDLQVTKQTVQNWLNGVRCPKFATVRYIEQLYGVAIEAPAVSK